MNKEPTKEYTVMTVSIDFGDSIRWRLFMFLPHLLMCITFIPKIYTGYCTWLRQGLMPRWYHKVAYIADHLVLCYFYCLLALLIGKVHGFRWIIRRINND